MLVDKQGSAGAHITDLPEPVSCVGSNWAVLNYVLVFGKHVRGRVTSALVYSPSSSVARKDQMLLSGIGRAASQCGMP